jgi:hypothetical protein
VFEASQESRAADPAGQRGDALHGWRRYTAERF